MPPRVPNENPRVPNEILLNVAQLRCAHPTYYDYNSLDSHHALDVPPYSHPEDWCAIELLLSSFILYSLASLYSWECVLVISVQALPSILTAVRRDTIFPGESALPRDIIRCLDLSFNLQLASNDLHDLVRCLPNLDTLVLSHNTSMLFFCNPCPSPNNIPLPFPSPFTSSLRAVLFASTIHGVTMEDIALLSLMVPRLERLQVAKFIIVGDATLQPTCTPPSYLFPALTWLAIGSFERSPKYIDDPSALSLALLLESLSIGSGLQSLRRLDILADIRIPHRFLQVHGSEINTLSITGATHECICLNDTFTQFHILQHLNILADPTFTPLPRTRNDSLSRISIHRPRSPPNLLLPHPAVTAVMHDIITEVIALSSTCPNLDRVQIVGPHGPLDAQWFASQQERLPSHISLSF
ncbi:hypothetical protein DFP72DRAFT_1084093 [Ephemerocybe angulata]|uniref:Uncharacterized protein n=1 Tax=Ephemerocybe angulata TaxID=980116 RepID=A0A8H6H8E4_9AGAR|nr:hypothetical protein DFP72DRAFT_1084093 [Tulosesus angulatus]